VQINTDTSKVATNAEDNAYKSMFVFFK